jgi:polyferredoxin
MLGGITMSKNKIMENLVDEIFEEKKKKLSKYFIFHLIGKLVLILGSGYLTYHNYLIQNYFFTFVCGLIFVYVLTLTLFGHVIKRWVKEVASGL